MMNKFQTTIFLLLTSTYAFTAPSTYVTRGQSYTPLRHSNEFGTKNTVTASPKIKTRTFVKGFKSDFTTQQESITTSSLNKEYKKSRNNGKIEPVAADEDNAYVRFAKDNPFMNNLIIATLKTCAADLLAQTVIAQTPLSELDLQRSLLFCIFGGLYSGAFQYLYQVQVFKKLFDVDKFTSQPWRQKLRDVPGVKALVAQTCLDLTILTLVYLPAFYIFKASVFSGSSEPTEWFSTGVDTYAANFGKDETDLLKVWLPADLICFSVPLYLRMPVRQSVSFLWTVYLSFARGGH